MGAPCCQAWMQGGGGVLCPVLSFAVQKAGPGRGELARVIHFGQALPPGSTAYFTAAPTRTGSGMLHRSMCPAARL